MLATTPVSAASCQCHDPCLEASRGDRKTCVSSAFGAFQVDLDGCLERDRTCLDACRAEKQDCRNATGLIDEVAVCQQQLDADKASCGDRFRVGSREWARCIDRARTRASRCLRRAPREVHRELRECRRQFIVCTESCSPGLPPDGVAVCREDAKGERQTAVAECQADFVLSASACINRDATCVESCNDTRDACLAPTNAAFQMAFAACTATRNAAVGACQAEFPDDQPALEQCIEDAQAAVFTCRDDALAAAQPGLEACTVQWAGCVKGCPKP